MPPQGHSVTEMRKALALIVLLVGCSDGGDDASPPTTAAEPTTTTRVAFDVEAEFLNLTADARRTGELAGLAFDCSLAETIEGYALEQAEPDGGRRSGLVSTDWNALPDEFIAGVLDDVAVRWPQLLAVCEEHDPLDG